MGFARIIDSLKFYEIKEQGKLRICFILIYLAHLARAIFALNNEDLDRLLDVVYSKGLQMDQKLAASLITSNVKNYLLFSVLISFLLFLIFIYITSLNVMNLEPEGRVLDLETGIGKTRAHVLELRVLALKYRSVRKQLLGEKLDLPNSSLDIKDNKLLSQLLRVIPRYLIIVVLAGLLFLISMPLLGLPMAVAAATFAFAPLYICLDKYSLIESFKLSARASKGFKFVMFSRLVLLFIIATLPTFFARRLFLNSPYSYFILDSLSRTLLILVAARQIAIYFLAFGREGSSRLEHV